MQKTDLLTGEQFLPKRRNQRFLSSQNRIKFHNIKAAEIRIAKSFIDKPLHLNYRILNSIMKGKNETFFHKQFLLGKGFYFGVQTHIENYKGKNCIAVYNYIVIPHENDQIKIVRK